MDELEEISDDAIDLIEAGEFEEPLHHLTGCWQNEAVALLAARSVARLSLLRR